MFLEVESNEPTTWMGSDYYNTMKAMDCKKEGKSAILVLHATCFLVFSPPTAIADILRWCVLSGGEQQKCADMGSEFQKKGLSPSVKCIRGESVTDCLNKIKVDSLLKVVLQQQSYGGNLKICKSCFDGSLGILLGSLNFLKRERSGAQLKAPQACIMSRHLHQFVQFVQITFFHFYVLTLFFENETFVEQGGGCHHSRRWIHLHSRQGLQPGSCHRRELHR